MAFSNALLPQYAPAEAGGGALAGLKNINAVRGQNLQNAILGSQAQYAPQTAQANAFLAQQQAKWFPYTQTMSVASNPLVWLAAKDNPDLQKTLGSMLSNSMNMVSGNQNMGGLSAPLSPGNGLLGMVNNGIIQPLYNKLFGQPENSTQEQPNNSSQNQSFGNAINQSPVENQNQQNLNNGSPLVPATQGGMAGYSAKIMAPYTEAAHKAGITFADPDHPGEVISAPTSKMATQLQNQISASQRTIPQLKSLPELWSPFMNLKGDAALAGSKIGNYLSDSVNPETLKSFGLSTNSDLPSKYSDAKLASLTSVESYLKSIGVPVTVDVASKLNSMIEPEFGENKQGYSNRIQVETQRIIKDFVRQSLGQIKNGYSSSPDAQGIGLQQPSSAQNEGIENISLGPSGEAKIQATKNIDGKQYVKINGNWHSYG